MADIIRVMLPSRRQLLLSLPALSFLPRAWTQVGAAPIRARALNHMTLSASDPKRTIDFYQGLFGMPVQARQGATTCLAIGGGPQFLAVSQTAAGVPPAINHFCLSVDGFDADRIMKVRVRMRGPEAGGAKEGTPELYFGDADGIVCQLQDVSYCGGAGVLGNV